MNLLWLDLEMTGLDPARDRILEVAAIVTDLKFNEIERYEAIVRQPAAVLTQMSAWPLQQHTASGLLKLVPTGQPEKQVEQEISHILERHFKEPAVMAGNSIHFDRQFIKQYWPKVEAKLHYRMLDVSSWKIVMQNKFKINFNKQETHRSLEDIKESIAELQAYLGYFKNDSR